MSEVCGGCGNSDETKRCIGCLHNFTSLAERLSVIAKTLDNDGDEYSAVATIREAIEFIYSKDKS